ncbi:hypothetical protein [Halodesulfovibrio spirochaetisodalis]|uniref:Uncharacterized protein n=1 Tax=Halodesulfovibrio spirochaetisodalis TaxID=1560234 RepID=A0A1B7XAR7_9BACT|nr:hypothetical protein [Halodesulfovibrio spirochaetisodalis]OBQ46473.1 hypothetical protein SP90_12285 [Halodesulfovibrio spirochaetisodalis]
MDIETVRHDARKLIAEILYESKTDESDMLLLSKLEDLMPVPEAVEQKYRPEDFYRSGEVDIDLFVDVCLEQKLNAVAMLHFMKKYCDKETRKTKLKALLKEYLENMESYSEEEEDELLAQMQHLTPNSDIISYIFWSESDFEHEPTVDEIVERCFMDNSMVLESS